MKLNKDIVSKKVYNLHSMEEDFEKGYTEFYDRTILSANVILDVSDFVVKLSELHTKDLHDKILLYSGATAFDTDTGMHLKVDVEFEELEKKAEPGVCEITYFVRGTDISLTVEVGVVANDVKLTQEPYFYAKDLFLNLHDKYDKTMHNAFCFVPLGLYGKLMKVECSFNLVDMKNVGSYKVLFKVALKKQIVEHKCFVHVENNSVF